MQEDELFYLQAYLALSETRDVSTHGIQRIKYQEIVAWLDIHNIKDPERREEITFFITSLDSDYIQGLIDANSKSGNKQS